MFSQSNLFHNTDLAPVTDLINSKRVKLQNYVNEQKSNYNKRLTAASNLAEDGGPLLSKYDFDDNKIGDDYVRRVNNMAPENRSRIIKNLSTENFYKSSAKLFHSLSDRKFVNRTFPLHSTHYNPTDLDDITTLWKPQDKFEVFLKVKKTDQPLFQQSTQQSTYEVTSKQKKNNIAFVKPIPNPIEVKKGERLIPKARPLKPVPFIPNVDVYIYYENLAG